MTSTHIHTMYEDDLEGLLPWPPPLSCDSTNHHHILLLFSWIHSHVLKVFLWHCCPALLHCLGSVLRAVVGLQKAASPPDVWERSMSWLPPPGWHARPSPTTWCSQRFSLGLYMSPTSGNRRLLTKRLLCCTTQASGPFSLCVFLMFHYDGKEMQVQHCCISPAMR